RRGKLLCGAFGYRCGRGLLEAASAAPAVCRRRNFSGRQSCLGPCWRLCRQAVSDRSSAVCRGRLIFGWMSRWRTAGGVTFPVRRANVAVRRGGAEFRREAGRILFLRSLVSSARLAHALTRGSVRGRGRALLSLHAFDRKNDGNADQTQNGDVAKVVDV